MPWSMRSEGSTVVVVRQRDNKVVGRHKDRKRALAQMKVLYSLEKAQFASRSEAGRYAANMRWKGNVKEVPKQRELPLKEFVNIIETSTSSSEIFSRIAEKLGKKMKPKVANFTDEETNLYRGVQDVDRDVQRLLDGEIRPYEFATWGQGIYASADMGEAANYGSVLGLKLDDSAKIVTGELNWAKAEEFLDLNYEGSWSKGTGQWVSSVLNMRLLTQRSLEGVSQDYSPSDFYNFYWASQGYDGAKIGYETVLFNGEKLTVNQKDLGRAIQKSLVDLLKASFGGDRSAAGRYAANERWKGNAKDDISNQVTVGFESEGRDRGTVWATDKATGKVVGALKFDANFIGKIYVAKDYRRKGIGSFLYNEAKKRNGGVEMKADDYTVSGAGFMSAVTGKEVFQTGDNSWAGIEWKSWLERLDRDALKKHSLIDLLKASFGGDRSEAGRYAANMRWKGQGKESRSKPLSEKQIFALEQSFVADYKKHYLTDDLMPTEQLSALQSYTGLEHRGINELHRDKERSDRASERGDALAEAIAKRREESKNLDALIDSTPPLESDLTVYRGLHDSGLAGYGLHWLQNLYRDDATPLPLGQVVVDKGFMSSTLSFQSSHYFSGSGFVLEIKIPKGGKALVCNVADMVTRRTSQKIESEHEVLLPRDTALLITGARKDLGSGRVVVEMEVVL